MEREDDYQISETTAMKANEIIESVREVMNRNDFFDKINLQVVAEMVRIAMGEYLETIEGGPECVTRDDTIANMLAGTVIFLEKITGTGSGWKMDTVNLTVTPE